MFKDVEALVLRATVGGLMAGHGAQKLFGAFEGPGMQGTAGMMKSMGLEPAERWAVAAALAEFGGGVLTALGLFNPLGPLGIMSSMAVATGTAHWGKPIWVSKGGAELPVTNSAAALALAMAGPGQLSLDYALGIQLPKAVSALATVTAGGLVAYALTNRLSQQAAPSQEQAPEEGRRASA